MRFTLGRQALLVVALPLIVEIVFVTTLAFMLQQVKLEREREAYARDLAYEVNCLMTAFLKRGIIVLLGKMSEDDPAKLGDQFQRERSIITVELRKIRRLIKDHPREKVTFEKIVDKKDEFNNFMKQAVRLTVDGKRLEAARVFPQGQRILEEAMALTDEMIDEQNQIELKEREAQKMSRLIIQITLAGLLIASVLLALALMRSFNRFALNRLEVLTESVSGLASGKPLGPRIAGNDEISELDSAFRNMAGDLDWLLEKERAIIDNAADVICSFDEHGCFISVNAAAQSHWGYWPEELIGVDLAAIVSEENGAGAFKKLVEREGAAIELKIKCKDGLVAHMQWTSRRSEEPDEKGALYCVAHNVTARVEIEQLKSDFVAMISHDLRSPLTSVQLAHELFLDGAYGELSDDGLERIESADMEIDRLLVLINQILDIEKWEAGRLEIEKEPVSIDNIVESAVKRIKGLSKQSGVTVKVIPHKPTMVLVDESRVVEALAILLANAVNSSAGGSVVSLKLRPDNRFLTLAVSDSGPLICEEDTSAIFDRFAVVATRGRHGTGLPLALCKAVVSLHGGEIGLDRENDSSCTFWFTLPLQIT